MAVSLIDSLLASDEPSIRWRTRRYVLRDDDDARPMRALRAEIRRSARVRRLLDGLTSRPSHPYDKWRGAHWVLQHLAELGLPSHDADLEPIVDRVLGLWLTAHYTREYDATETTVNRVGIPRIGGKHRSHASMQGGALLAATRLGFVDERTDRLAGLLRTWQWPDGGWNCSRKRSASCSSVYETLLSVRGLAAHAGARVDEASSRSAEAGAEMLLERRLLFHRSTGRPIDAAWMKLHYPVYWHYDALAALKGIAEVGLLNDPRCDDALDLLERKQLASGGWPAEAKFYRSGDANRGQNEFVDWGGVTAHKLNEWVTVDALAVLTAAGRTSRSTTAD